MPPESDTMEKIVALCRRRGFIFGSSEIYGGIGGFWDYGPLGTELKRNIKDAWWNDMVRNPPPGPKIDEKNIEYQMVGVDCSIIMNPKVWEASGHVGGFSDPMVDDRETKQRFRADQLVAVYLSDSSVSAEEAGRLLADRKRSVDPTRIPDLTVIASSPREAAAILGSDKSLRKLLGIRDFEEIGGPLGEDAYAMLKFHGERKFAVLSHFPQELFSKAAARIPSPFTGKTGTLTEPREFNLMFQTYVGALQDSTSIAYLRPETAQGIFANFKNVIDSTRVRLPFGIAQIGKAFRNEINPRNYTFRSREFEQMEIEFFCHPSEADVWYEYWRDLRFGWYTSLGLKSDKLRLREHDPDELAHYAKGCADVEYEFPFGVSELEGIANRTDFDLTAHKTASGKDLSYFDLNRGEKGERYIPYVIEPSAGVDRFALAIICEAYSYDESRASPEFMKFHPRLAPIKAAVFPLVAKDGMPDIAEPIFREIKKSFPCQYDAKQSIGKRYARMDEAGTPFCFTIDGQTKEDGTVTVRDRNDASQIRIDKSRCAQYLRDKLNL